MTGSRPVAAFLSPRATGFSLATAAPELEPLVANWAKSRSASEIAGLALDQIPRVFGTTICAVVLADTLGRPAEVALQGMADRDYDTYDVIWRPHDFLLAKVVTEQVPTMLHEAIDDREWRRSPIYLGFAQRIDVDDCMQAPLYGANGAIAGAVYLARSAKYRRFDRADLRRATVLAGYLSAGLARVAVDQCGGPAGASIDLTKREREVVALVARGLNNPEISLALQIARETVKQTLRRVYRKLEVNGRAQMVARLAELPWFRTLPVGKGVSIEK